MANLLNRFNKTVVGSESKLADYKSTISSTGDFRRITDINVVINSWNNILVTPKRTYMFDPEFGSNLYRFIFEPLDNQTEKEIVEEVVTTLRTYDDRANIKNVSVEFLSNKKGFNISIDIEYNGDTTSFNTAILEENYFEFYKTLD